MKRTILYSVIALLVVAVVNADQTVKSVQQALKDQGFYYGNVTGDKSAETTSAIRRYQIRSGLQVTGQIDPATLRSLNVNSNSASSPQTSSNPAIPRSNSPHPDENSNFAQTSSPAPSPERAPDRQVEPAQPFAMYNSGPRRTGKRIALAEVQRQLMDRGYYQGSIDGRYGRRADSGTCRSLVEWLQSRRIEFPSANKRESFSLYRRSMSRRPSHTLNR